MIKIISVFIGAILSISTILSGEVIAQSPAKYICDIFDGKLSEPIEGRSFVGDAYRCDVKEQWDMMIQSEINEIIITDKYFRDAKKWKETYVDSENYIRRSFSFKSVEFFIVNLYVPYEKKTDHFFIAQ